MPAQLRKLTQRLFGHTTADTRRVSRAMIDDGRSTNMQRRTEVFQAIPGMLPVHRGLILYSLAYANTLDGDIVEIGSWQGRSTCFLAQACRDASNGVVRAVDHFRGTPGNERHYRVGRHDLSDLESNFRRNIGQAGLDEYVRLYNMTGEEATRSQPEDFRRLRMIFIDGDHRYEAVIQDIHLFAPHLLAGGVLVFDDYHSDGPGVVQAARDQVLSTGAFSCFTQFDGMLVARKRPTIQAGFYQEGRAA